MGLGHPSTTRPDLTREFGPTHEQLWSFFFHFLSKNSTISFWTYSSSNSSGFIFTPFIFNPCIQSFSSSATYNIRSSRRRVDAPRPYPSRRKYAD